VQIAAINLAVSSHLKGRIAIVMNAGRDAVDAGGVGREMAFQGGLLSVRNDRRAQDERR